MNQLAVVYVPNIDVTYINSFREKYDPSYQIIPPHITLVSPISGISENKLIEHVEKVTKNLKTFPIQLTGLEKSFDDYLFLLVKEGSEKIVHVHSMLYMDILASFLPTDFPFTPHITLGYFRTKENIFDSNLYNVAYKEAENAHFDISCNFDCVSVIAGDGVSPAKVVKIIDLYS